METRFRKQSVLGLNALIQVEVMAKMARPKLGSGRLAPSNRHCRTEHNADVGHFGLIPNPVFSFHY